MPNPNPLLIHIPALLSGSNGMVATCLLETLQESSSANKTRCRITDDLPELADGEYMVEFAEQSARANKCHGQWELVVIATDMDITDAA